MISKTVLKNGVRIVTSSAKDAQSLAVGIWVSTGSRNEVPDYLGISHYLEHLVFKGTKNYSCQKKLSLLQHTQHHHANTWDKIPWDLKR